MLRVKCLLSWMFAAVAVVGLVAWIGCSSTTAPDKPKDASTGPTQQGASETATADEQTAAREGLAELSPEDRAAAESRRVCPVTGELLGSMGKPYKVVVKGQTVFLCCSGCEEQIKKDPDTYLAKLKANEK